MTRAEPQCPFCEIAAGRETAHRVVESEAAVAFLDRRPLFHGHCLLVPRDHVETLADLPVALVGPLFSEVRLLARAVEEAMEAQGTFVALNNRISQSVPHLHVHVVPRRRRDGLRGFFWPRHKYESEAQMKAVAEAIEARVAALRRRGDESAPR